MKRIKIKKAKDFCCPNCQEDLRKVGVIVYMTGWKADIFKYDDNGVAIGNGNGDEYDGEYSTDRLECGNCGGNLHRIDEYWEKLPRVIT